MSSAFRYVDVYEADEGVTHENFILTLPPNATATIHLYYVEIINISNVHIKMPYHKEKV